MVEAFDSLAKATLAKELKNFISIAEVVFQDYLIVALVVVITIVENVHLLQTSFVSLHCLRRALLDEVASDLLPAILSKVVNFMNVSCQLQLFKIIQL